MSIEKMTPSAQAEGNAVSTMFKELAAQPSLANLPAALGEAANTNGGLSGVTLIPLDGIGATGYVMGLGTDGVGTKIEVAERMKIHWTVAHDLVAMSCDDAAQAGLQPVGITDLLDANAYSEDSHGAVRQLAYGLRKAAEIAGVVVQSGESAGVGNRIQGHGDFNYLWSSAVVSLGRQERIIDGTEVQPGDTLVGFREYGLRSNGFTAAMEAFARGYGDDWHEAAFPDRYGKMSTLGAVALQPSTIYTPALVAMTGGFDPNRQPQAKVHGVAHITGGGIPEKLGRILGVTGFGAEIDRPFDPPFVMETAQNFYRLPGETGTITDQQAYQLFHMGTGLIVVTPEPEAVKAAAVERGYKPDDINSIGQVTDEPGIRITSRGLKTPGEVLEYPI